MSTPTHAVLAKIVNRIGTLKITAAHETPSWRGCCSRGQRYSAACDRNRAVRARRQNHDRATSATASTRLRTGALGPPGRRTPLSRASISTMSVMAHVCAGTPCQINVSGRRAQRAPRDGRSACLAAARPTQCDEEVRRGPPPVGRIELEEVTVKVTSGQSRISPDHPIVGAPWRPGDRCCARNAPEMVATTMPNLCSS